MQEYKKQIKKNGYIDTFFYTENDNFVYVNRISQTNPEELMSDYKEFNSSLEAKRFFNRIK